MNQRKRKKRYINIPRKSLFLRILMLFSLETVICILWNGIFIIVSAGLLLVLVYVIYDFMSLWDEYYSGKALIVLLFILFPLAYILSKYIVKLFT